MSAEDIDAEEKFWETPELVETLLPFLDVASILRLAQSHFSSKKDSLVLGILKRALVWNKLIEMYTHNIYKFLAFKSEIN